MLYQGFIFGWYPLTTMVETYTPYEYGDAEIEAVGEDPPHEQQHGTDMVIVDGSAMSYRSYTSAEHE
jgi:hypothetical protein